MAKKTKRREIFEKAYVEFQEGMKDEDHEVKVWELGDRINDFIVANPHKSHSDCVLAVMSAICAIENDIDPDECSDACKGGAFLAAIYEAGRRHGLDQGYESDSST